MGWLVSFEAGGRDGDQSAKLTGFSAHNPEMNLRILGGDAASPVKSYLKGSGSAMLAIDNPIKSVLFAEEG